jgi:cytochrome c-type biogenesis protein CcmH/NrfG
MLQRDAELDGAEQAFRQAIGLLPDFEDFRIALASVLEQKERRMQPARTEQ